MPGRQLSLAYERKDWTQNRSLGVTGKAKELWAWMRSPREQKGQELSYSSKMRWLAADNVRLRLAHGVCVHYFFYCFLILSH